MAQTDSVVPFLKPVQKSVTVECSCEATFALFTAEIASWWPMDRYSVSQDRTRNVVLEPRIGGDIYEERDDGETFPWGKVLIWEEPSRLVMSWHPGREPDAAQEVEVRFTAIDGGTRVDLEHRNWDKLGEDATGARDGYDKGWTEVLGQFLAPACAKK